VKRTNSTSQRRRSSSDEEDNDTSTALYSESQTELYIPPPVTNGIIPKNPYGNINIYVPSMVPAGAAHVIRPSISLAAQFAGIDYADAVTGFDFVRSKANARINGIVVAQENVDGLLEVWEGMMERVKSVEERRRVHGVMDRWRRFLIGMGIRRRLEETHGKVEEDENVVQGEDDGSEDLGGGFLRGAVQDGQGFGSGHGYAPELMRDKMGMNGLSGQPTSQQYAPERHVAAPEAGDEENYRESSPETQQYQRMVDDLSGGFEKDKDVDMTETEGGGFIAKGKKNERPDYVQEDEDSDGGGFIYEDEDGIL